MKSAGLVAGRKFRDQRPMRHDPNKMLRFTQFALENLSDAAYCVEEDARIVYVNQAATSMLGYSREELFGMRIHELNADIEAAEWPKIWDMLKRAQRRTFEARHRAKDGHLVPVEVSANLLVFEGTEYSCAFARNISERKELEQRLRQSEKMKAIGELAGGVAHDFNNQLTGVAGYADLVLDRLQGDAEGQQFVEQIQLAVRRASSLTQKLLTFSREDNQRSEVVDLHAVVAEAISMLERSIDKKITISEQFARGRPKVVGDSSRLQSAILNVALNARDAMPSGGNLRIKSETMTLDPDFCRRQALPVEPGPYVMLELADDGEGIPREIQSRLFEPFFTTKGKGHGTGLGLPAVYSAVKSHRGTISIDSEVGRGTVVRLYLPLHRGQEEARPSSVPPTAGLARRLRVMVVEDEEPLRRIAELTLKSLGCDVVTFENGAPAVEYYAASWGEVDVVLLDICMPVMDGTDTFHALRKINPAAQVLLASGYSADGDASALLQNGAKGFVQKPYRKATLAEKLGELMRERAPANG